jgi:hypothetical protein
VTAGTFAIELNGRSYRWPRRPVVVVCVAGFDPAYLEDGLRRGTVFGGAESEHDLTGLAGHRLRSHGGMAEREVPLILSEPLSADYRRRVTDARLRNFDIFDFAINGVD